MKTKKIYPKIAAFESQILRQKLKYHKSRVYNFCRAFQICGQWLKFLTQPQLLNDEHKNSFSHSN
jgi:hypothetical protein